MNENTRKAILYEAMKDPDCSVNINYAVEYKEKLQELQEKYDILQETLIKDNKLIETLYYENKKLKGDL